MRDCWILCISIAVIGVAMATNETDTFLYRTIMEYGQAGLISADGLNTLLVDYRANYEGGCKADRRVPANASQCFGSLNVTDCLTSMCMNGHDIFRFHSLAPEVSITADDFRSISPTVLAQVKCIPCHDVDQGHHGPTDTSPTSAEVWGYGFLMVTIINMCAVLGYGFLPIMKTKMYAHVLMFMVALAVGALSANGILVLVPEALELHLEEGDLGEIYIWRMLTVIGGVYLFFNVERLLQFACCCRKPRPKGDDTDTVEVVIPGASPTATVSSTATDGGVPNKGFDSIESAKAFDSEDQKEPRTTPNYEDIGRTESSKQLVKGSAEKTGSPHGHQQAKSLSEVKSVAWMIIFGDALHNFIDGLSIGVAFTVSVLAGFSVSIGIFCEELPHELGDFAILLASGMTIKQAVLFNFASALSCYLGLVIGVMIGELTEGGPWIFAIAAGMFLYISLVDMLPEMNAAAEEDAKKGYLLRPFLVQNAGLLTGFAIIFLLSYFGEYINFE